MQEKVVSLFINCTYVIDLYDQKTLHNRYI
jgi:hypothetical protein